MNWSEKLCPDCKHKAVFHDMYGCVLRACSMRGSKPCELSGEFLKEFFEDDYKPKTLTQINETRKRNFNAH